MRLVALLSWFDENPTHLQELVASLAEAGVDHLVAVDGPYRLFPTVDPRSSPLEYVVLSEGCAVHGIGLTVHTTPERWGGNEIEKRNLMFRLGHAVAEPYDDWLWVIDADEVVARAENLRSDLEGAESNVGSVLEYENGTPKRLERRLFRAHPKGIGVQRAHYFYRDGDGDVLWGPGQVPSARLDVEVFHRPLARSAARNEARNIYYAARREHNVETEVF